MTIDGAIEHAKDQQEIFGGKHGEFLTNVAGWLEELKNLKPSKKGFITIGQTVEEFEKEIRAKAIDEFFNELCKASESVRPVGWTQRYCVVTIDKAMEIVEELKAGGEE